MQDAKTAGTWTESSIAPSCLAGHFCGNVVWVWGSALLGGRRATVQVRLADLSLAESLR